MFLLPSSRLGAILQLKAIYINVNKVAATLPRTMLLNLPEGFDVSTPTAPLQLITPETHTGDDRSGIRVLKRHFARLMPTAPIELGASGLMVFSQDGKIVRKLVEEAKTNEQEYTVDVSGEIEPDGLQQLNSKIIKNGWPLPSAKVSWQSETRLRIGRVSMGKLLPGEWRYLPEDLWF
jgi:23S rRNA pseudouridine2604 synthase